MQIQILQADKLQLVLVTSELYQEPTYVKLYKLKCQKLTVIFMSQPLGRRINLITWVSKKVSVLVILFHKAKNQYKKYNKLP